MPTEIQVMSPTKEPPIPSDDLTRIAKLATELDVLVRARYPVIAIQTHEEVRLRRILKALSDTERHRDKGLYFWSRTVGWKQDAGGVNGKIIASTEDPESALEYVAKAERGLFVLCDYTPYLAPYGQEDALLVRKLRELAWEIKTKPVTVFIVGPTIPSIVSLQKEIKTIDLNLPDDHEVSVLVQSELERLSAHDTIEIHTDEHTREQLTRAFLGLTETEIENGLAKAVITQRGISVDAVPLILEEKRDVIRQSGSLTYTHPEPASNLGGYKNIRRLLEEAAVTFTPSAKEYGVEPAKGILLIGLPGTGKDLCKRIASSILSRPLLDLDFGSVMGEGGGIIGSAAMSVKRALDIATTLKGILGISEFEKAVGGLQSSNRTDGGETARTIAYLLNWMNDQSDVFVIATANDVRQLAPEQVRQGRFGQVVFVDLPTAEDRADIFAVHLRKRNREPEQFDIDTAALAEASDGYSGAEIEAAVKGALLDSYMDGARRIKTADIIRRVKSIRPTSEVKREDIEELREWAKTHMAVSADAIIAGPSDRKLEF